MKEGSKLRPNPRVISGPTTVSLHNLPGLDEIKKRRKRLGISQRELARRLKISQSMVAKIENDKINPTYKIVQGIFSHLNSLHSISRGKAGDIASRPVVSVRETHRVSEVVRILQSHGFKQVPVLRGSHNLGSVSERSISRRILETNRPEKLLRMPIAKLMDEALPTVSESLPVEGIIPLLQQTQAALTTKEGRITGIITNADLLKLISKPES